MQREIGFQQKSVPMDRLGKGHLNFLKIDSKINVSSLFESCKDEANVFLFKSREFR